MGGDLYAGVEQTLDGLEQVNVVFPFSFVRRSIAPAPRSKSSCFVIKLEGRLVGSCGRCSAYHDALLPTIAAPACFANEAFYIPFSLGRPFARSSLIMTRFPR